MSRRLFLIFLLVLWAVGFRALPSAAQTDHLECFRIKDPVKLNGQVDLETPLLGLDPACKISKAKYLCSPASMGNPSVFNGALPIVPQEIWSPPVPGNRICYSVRCPKELLPDQLVTDQFGTRPVSGLKAKMVCTPAVKGPIADPDLFRGFPATGQTTIYPTNKNGIPGAAVPEDGTLKSGSTLTYVDNGDGTISDLNTGLTWEKKCEDGGLHDEDNFFPWSSSMNDTIWDWLDDVNAEGGTGFAGYSDWRIPNVRELQSIVNYEFYDPSTSAEFESACVPGCSVLTCSCTISSPYWTSTTFSDSSSSALVVGFDGGYILPDSKNFPNFVRAVRGGS